MIRAGMRNSQMVRGPLRLRGLALRARYEGNQPAQRYQVGIVRDRHLFLHRGRESPDCRQPPEPLDCCERMLHTARLPVDRLFRAFSDRTRLRILHLLLQGELCVCDLVAILRVPQPTASRHLSYLRRAGLVRVRQERSWKYYSLAEPRNSFHAMLLECLDTCFAEVPELGRDTARRAKSGVGKCCD